MMELARGSIRVYRLLFVFTLCSVARVAEAQFTPRDTAMLVDVIAEQIRAQLGTGAAREPFVIVPNKGREAPDVRFASRVSAAVHARDSSLVVAEPTRSTRRVSIGTLELVTRDTAAITLWVAWCKGTPPIYAAHNMPLAFLRVRDRWVFVERNVGGSGTGSSGCPW